MNIEAIDTAFDRMINQRNIHRVLGISSQNVRNYRQNLKSGRGISLELKIQMLQRADLLKQDEQKEYTRADLVELIEWYNKEKQQYEADYAVHKWKLQRGKGKPEHINNIATQVAGKLISKAS